MVKSIKIGQANLTFVFRHKWDKESKERYSMEFREYRIGLWCRKRKIVGVKEFKQPSRWHKNLVGSYMVGIDLIVCKVWVSFNKGGMSLSL